ncbi:hypothetical protein ACHAXT_002434 [Thalassiosira profunda]
MTRSSRASRGNGSKKPAAKKRQSNASEPMYQVEKIVDSKRGKSGAPLYRTRWKGYSASDDTWEPTENVASTGHVDRFQRRARQRKLKRGTPGVAVIEYEDGERETVDLKVETFRGSLDGSDDERDDDSVQGNNYFLVSEGACIEILWKHANIYFACKVISWTPLKEENSSRKRSSNEEGELPTKRIRHRLLRGDDRSDGNSPHPDAELGAPSHATPGGKKGAENNAHDDSVHSSEPISDDDSYSPRHVQREGKGVPLFNESSDDFDSSDDDDGSDGEEADYSAYRHLNREAPKLSFEELWEQKIKRTQELMENERR